MKNTLYMMFYAVAVVLLYAAEIILFANAASVAGMSLVTLGFISLGLGFICQCAARKAFAQYAPASGLESAAAI